MSGKNNITVRKQKIRKNHTKAKLVFFLVLTALLLFVAAFAKYLCPYDPYAQDLVLAQKPPGPEHLLGTDRYGRDMLFPCDHRKYDQYLCNAAPGCGDHCGGNGYWYFLWLEGAAKPILF